MSSIIRLRRGVIAVVLLARAPAHAGPTRLPHPPYPPPDGERQLRRSRSVQRPLCNVYRTSGRHIDLTRKLGLRSHTRDLERCLCSTNDAEAGTLGGVDGSPGANSARTYLYFIGN